MIHRDPDDEDSFDHVPLARYYVTAVDAYMSDWGRAEGRTNLMILPVDDRLAASNVAKALAGRSEMEKIQTHGGGDRDRLQWMAQQKENFTSIQRPALVWLLGFPALDEAEAAGVCLRCASDELGMGYEYRHTCAKQGDASQ
jgi:hypothetical protein